MNLIKKAISASVKINVIVWFFVGLADNANGREFFYTMLNNLPTMVFFMVLWVATEVGLESKMFR